MEKEGRELIEQYIVQRTQKRAFLAVKWAQTLDGFIADKDGNSKWITGEEARKKVHQLRAQFGAIAVGAKTAIKDDPELTIRKFKTHHTPARIIIAGKTKLPSGLKVFCGEPRTIVVSELKNPFIGKPSGNIEIIRIDSGEEFWKRLLEKLPEQSIGSVFLEGGGITISSAINEGIADKLYCFIAPNFLSKGVPAIINLKRDNLKDTSNITKLSITRYGEDVLLSGGIF
jgi:diaminohydroxyphosphoribosylaminopyrimidine deaminase / 5-amino-6-(5-phosphoribosylamino)uracil reductase